MEEITMVKTVSFSNRIELDEFINENGLTKDDIIQIMANGQSKSAYFHLTYTIPQKSEKENQK